MGKLTTASGLVFDCDGATTGRQYSNYLHIHTNALDFIEAAKIFSDPAETLRLQYDEKDVAYIFDNYTIILGIEADPVIQKPGELLIRLGKKEDLT